MRERRGPLGRTVGAVAQGIAGAARRRQEERDPRVLVYDRDGHPTLLVADTAARAALIDIAGGLIDLAGRPAADDAAADAGPDVDEQAVEASATAGSVLEDPSGLPADDVTPDPSAPARRPSAEPGAPPAERERG